MKILVVDTQEELAPVLELLGKTPGNEIRSVQTGGAALLACKQWGGVELLICEVFLEPMNGFTLRNKLENRCPGLRTIFISAYDLAPYAEHTEGAEVVAKPVSASTLFPAIARALAGGSAPAAPAEIPPAPVEELPATPVEAPPAPEEVPPAAPVSEPVEIRHNPVAALAPTQSQLPFSPPEAVAPVPATVVPAAATPRAIPVPTATAAVPRIAPPKAVSPAPAAVPRPAAQPSSPTAVPRPAAQPSSPTAVPRPAAQPSSPTAIPRPATQAGSPVAVPRMAGTPKATPAGIPRPGVAGAVPRPAIPVDPLIGKTLGSYRIESRLGTGKWGPVYHAIQTSMDRPVAMEVLSEDRQKDETARQEFVASARAKAAVQHPHILSVYEADQAEGHFFYTHEYVDGSTLAQLARRGEKLSEPAALQTIKFVAQALANLDHQKVPHSVPDASDIFIGKDGLPHLSNVAQATEGIPVVQEEIRALGGVVRMALPGGQAQDRGLQAMLVRMGLGGLAGFQSWPALFQAIQAIEPKVVPADAFKLSAQDEAAIRAVEKARKRAKLQVIYSIVGLVVFICLAGWLIWWKFMKPSVADHSADMVEIPAGDFIYQNGQKETLPAFWIDRYEVTMGDYAKFLAYLKSHDDTTEFDDPLQPKGLSHIPSHWDIYYGHAASSFAGYRKVQGAPISLDCPVFNVDYYDAYAYAKWKGRRLPTQKEWEKAARGPSGNIYPWGNEWDPKKCNSGEDYKAEIPADYKPAVDGYVWWAPVDAISEDKSAYGVIGMAGNVSEWTDSWDATHSYPVIRGGNFKYKAENSKATYHIDNAPPTSTSESLGFRTASDKPPGQ